MKNIDFKFFSEPSGDDDNAFNKAASNITKEIAKQKHDLITVAIIEIEGYYPSPDEVKANGGICSFPNGLAAYRECLIHNTKILGPLPAGTEIIFWKSNPIIRFNPINYTLTPLTVSYEFLYA